LQPAPYSGLTPNRALDALASVGLQPDGRLLALGSYENRVYQAWMDEGPPLVAKFYRPARWSDAQILEEHAFTLELANREIPVVAPLAVEGATLHAFEGFRFAVFPRHGGRAPELEDAKTLEWIGRFVGRIHAVGAMQGFRDRPALDVESHGVEPRECAPQDEQRDDERRRGQERDARGAQEGASTAIVPVILDGRADPGRDHPGDDRPIHAFELGIGVRHQHDQQLPGGDLDSPLDLSLGERGGGEGRSLATARIRSAIASARIAAGIAEVPDRKGATPSTTGAVATASPSSGALTARPNEDDDDKARLSSPSGPHALRHPDPGGSPQGRAAKAIRSHAEPRA
jgi:hypothetical protein